MSFQGWSRRELLIRSAALGAGLSTASDFAALGAALAPAESLGPIPFVGESAVRFGETTGEGLAGRRYFDLGSLTPESALTPTERFFIRTRRPRYAEPVASWRLEVRALHGGPTYLKLAELEAMAEPRGRHLLESIENGPNNSFGLVSAAEWHGVSFTRLFERTEVPGTYELPWRVLVEGDDRHAGLQVGGVAGASWVFSAEDLTKSGAFLATRMNGEPLLPDHGAPVRLVVPGWYGCTWIKWVRSIVFVPTESTLATAQMREYAETTFHRKETRRAADFLPVTLAPAALPLRVDRVSKADGSAALSIKGVTWGSEAPVTKIIIRFSRDEAWKAVDVLTPRAAGSPWQLWSHLWQPAGDGVFEIDARVDGAPHHRRIARRHYARKVRLGAGDLSAAT